MLGIAEEQEPIGWLGEIRAWANASLPTQEILVERRGREHAGGVRKAG